MLKDTPLHQGNSYKIRSKDCRNHCYQQVGLRRRKVRMNAANCDLRNFFPGLCNIGSTPTNQLCGRYMVLNVALMHINKIIKLIPMKNLNILTLAIAILAVQACELKSEKNAETMEMDVSAITNEVSIAASEKSSRIEKERAARIEKRRVEREKLAASSPTFTDASGEVIFIKSEVDPSFAGGDEAMMDYLRDNVKFPEDALSRKVEGTVFVDFIIGSNGRIRNAEILDTESNEVDQSLRDEAVRAVASMPEWAPGRQQGKAVNVKFSIPITFDLK